MRRTIDQGIIWSWSCFGGVHNLLTETAQEGSPVWICRAIGFLKCLVSLKLVWHFLLRRNVGAPWNFSKRSNYQEVKLTKVEVMKHYSAFTFSSNWEWYILKPYIYITDTLLSLQVWYNSIRTLIINFCLYFKWKSSCTSLFAYLMIIDMHYHTAAKEYWEEVRVIDCTYWSWGKNIGMLLKIHPQKHGTKHGNMM